MDLDARYLTVSMPTIERVWSLSGPLAVDSHGVRDSYLFKLDLVQKDAVTLFGDRQTEGAQLSRSPRDIFRMSGMPPHLLSSALSLEGGCDIGALIV